MHTLKTRAKKIERFHFGNHATANTFAYHFSLIFLLCFSLGCKKETLELPGVVIPNPVQGEIRAIHILQQGKWIIGGGQDNLGQIYTSADSGQTWFAATGIFYHKITDIAQIGRAHV